MNDITIWRQTARFERPYAAIVIAVISMGLRFRRPKVGGMRIMGWHLGAPRCTPLSDRRGFVDAPHGDNDFPATTREK